LLPVDQHQHFKSFICQMTCICLEHSSTNVEKSLLGSFKFADYLFKPQVAMFSAV